jgi:hypothetical protein
VSPYVDLPGALSIEAGRHGELYAGTFGAFSQSASTIVRIDGRHHHGHRSDGGH